MVSCPCSNCPHDRGNDTIPPFAPRCSCSPTFISFTSICLVTSHHLDELAHIDSTFVPDKPNTNSLTAPSHLFLVSPSICKFAMFLPDRSMLLFLSFPSSHLPCLLCSLFSANNPFPEKFAKVLIGESALAWCQRMMKMMVGFHKFSKEFRLTYMLCGVVSSSNQVHPHKRGQKKTSLGSPPPDTS